MYAFQMAFNWAIIVTLITFIAGAIDLALEGVNGGSEHSVGHWIRLVAYAVTVYVIAEAIGWVIFYDSRPAFTGVLGGQLGSFIFITLFTAITCGAQIFITDGLDTRKRDTAPWASIGGTGLAALLLVVLLVYLGVNYLVVDGKYAKQHVLAKLANVTMMGQNDIFPQTDEHHLVLVTQGIAYYKGQQSLGSTGQNLGSKFETNQGEYTLQSVQKHLYWVAPLVYKHNNSLNAYDTPGYIIVDAENPNNPANLVESHHLRWTVDAMWGHNLMRHVYSSGYTYCNLLDPTLEIDDSGPLSANGMVDGGVPYYTIACSEPATQYYGNVVKKVLLVNANTGVITAYNSVQDVPAWVDRIYDEQTINEYMGWYGSYSQAGWPNFSGSNVTQVAHSDLQILYSKVDEEPVYVVEMTSSGSNDQSSTGIALCHTRFSECDMYAMNGYGIADNVTNAFESSPKNTQQKYSVATPQLVNIYGTMTWVDVYYRGTDYGDQYAGVGLMPATNVTAGAVTESTDLTDALQQYQTYLTSVPTQNQQATSNSNHKTFTAKIARITSTTNNGNTTYDVLFQGVNHEFFADSAIYPLLPFVREGDTVTVTYNETGQYQVPILSIDDASLDAITGPVPTPTNN